MSECEGCIGLSEQVAERDAKIEKLKTINDEMAALITIVRDRVKDMQKRERSNQE